MRIIVNGEVHEVSGPTLARVLDELGYGGAVVATAVNGSFTPASTRPEVMLAEGDILEVLAPMQGG